MSFLPAVRLWLWISVFATIAGWTLSLVNQLNRGGYAVFIGLAAIFLWATRNQWAQEWQNQGFRPARFKKRFKRGLPLAFLFLAFLICLGGVLYAPTNHTALTYRTPRVLQWLAREHWFWIHTSNYRMNDRACGIEWLSAPLLLFSGSDRSLFLLNFFPFLLLPGLLYSLFTRLGVYPRVAWAWMWLVPTGYTFLLQAGSTANDTFATVYALAAVDFACRAWSSERGSDLAYSLLAAALLTGAKASNIPLLLPWLVAFAPLGLRFLGFKLPRISFLQSKWTCSPGGKPVAMVMIILALAVSFLPTAFLNVHFCGDWSGLALERTGMDMKNPFVGVWGNAFLFLLDNLVPPFFPAAGWWNQHALSVLPQLMVRPLVENFESSFHWLGELPTEDWVGVGFGLSWLIVIAFLASLRKSRDQSWAWRRRDAPPSIIRYGILLGTWMALLAYCVKSGMATGARLISPYYPLLMALLLIRAGQAQVVRQRWWRVAVWIVIGLAIPVVVLTPGRPLWPAHSILSHLQKMHPGRRLLSRAMNVYSVYGTRADPLAGIRTLLPANLPVVGFLARGDDPDISLWRPFGAKRVEHIVATDTAEEIRRRGIRYVVVGEFNFALNNTTFAEWQQRTGARLVATTNATVRVSEGAQPWYVLTIEP